LRGFGGSRKRDRERKLRERERKELGVVRKKFCRFCREAGVTFDYKDAKRLEKLLSERGKILSRRITGNCAKHQRKIAALIKRARFLALLPYVK